jgi:hypothetical protein
MILILVGGLVYRRVYFTQLADERPAWFTRSLARAPFACRILYFNAGRCAIFARGKYLA